MVTNREFQDVVDKLQQQYGDFTKDSNSLRTMLQHNFQIVAKDFISMCDIEADKFYLWITADSSDNSESYSMMKLIYSPGVQIGKESEEEDEFSSPEEIQNFQRAKEFYGTELFPNLNSFALMNIACNSQGAEVLANQISNNTGWQLRHTCPLVFHHQTYTFYHKGRSFSRLWSNSPIMESSCILYESGTLPHNRNRSTPAWNGWSTIRSLDEFRLYELSTNDIFSLNYPIGLAFI